MAADYSDRIARNEATVIHIQGTITEIKEESRRRTDGIMDAIEDVKKSVDELQAQLSRQHGFVAGVLFVFTAFFGLIAWFFNSRFWP